jgi:molybdate transport system regulatory protein
MLKKTKFKVNGRIWIECEDGTPLLGFGRIELLEKIHELGSIRKAAIAMEMSYQQAWNLINQMNTSTEMPFVISQKGGKGGGSATITEYGFKFIATFKNLNEIFQKSFSEQTTFINK